MSRHLARKSAISELKFATDRHLEIILKTRTHCFNNNLSKDKFLYTMAIPMIYSAWEGYFRISLSICLRRLCFKNCKAGNYPNEYITLWLQKEPFLSSFYRSIMNSVDLSVAQKPINKARFNALTEFQTSVRNWLKTPVNTSANFDKLVMTYSNVNGDIAELNASVIGLDVSTIDFNPLNELLGRRNEISHGGLINLIEEADAMRIATYTETLLVQFCDVTKTWLQKN
jgi:hypothetical protein